MPVREVQGSVGLEEALEPALVAIFLEELGQAQPWSLSKVRMRTQALGRRGQTGLAAVPPWLVMPGAAEKILTPAGQNQGLLYSPTHTLTCVPRCLMEKFRNNSTQESREGRGPVWGLPCQSVGSSPVSASFLSLVHPQNVPEVAVGTLTLQRWIPKLREVT